MSSLHSPQSSNRSPHKEAEDEEEEDDYLTMPIPSESSNYTSSGKKETLTQLRKRKLLHAETAGRPKSKAELAKEAQQRREEGLTKNLMSIGDGEKSKGLKMMRALGYRPGEALGKKAEEVGEGEGQVGAEAGKGDTRKRVVEPIQLEMKEDRSGIGRESEAKRKFREEAEKVVQGEKRRKVDEGEFVDRVRAEREERRNEGLVVGAQKVAERLEEEELDEQTRRKRKLTSVPVLWRGLVRQREIDEREKRMRHNLYMSLSSSGNGPEFVDPDEDNDDKMALGKNADLVEIDDEDLDADDEELDEFEALPPSEKLEKLVKFLRGNWNYCFWCKYKYEDESMEGCPGLTEDEHG